MRRLAMIVLFLWLLLAAFAAGWVVKGLNEPVGGMPTAAAVNQLAVPVTEAETTATSAPTEGVPTSTAAPTQAQPTSTPIATATPERAKWDIECNTMEGTVKCWDVIVDEGGEVARLYWVGPCLDPGDLVLRKQIAGQLYPDVVGDQWTYKFIPNRCDRPADRPSPNHLVIRTFEGPGNYALEFSPVGSEAKYIDFFEWNTAPTPAVELTLTATPSGATVEETPVPGLVQAYSPLRGFAASSTEDLHDTPGDGAQWIGTVLFGSPVYIWECGSFLAHPEGAYLSLVSHEGDGEVKVGWISTMGYTGEHPCTYYSAPGVGALVHYLVAAKKYGDEDAIRALPGLQFDPYAGVQDLED